MNCEYIITSPKALLKSSKLFIIIAILCRKPLFIHPFITLLTSQISTEEELALKTIEAESEARIQRVRIENKVENATREFELCTNLLLRGWNFLKGLLRKR